MEQPGSLCAPGLQIEDIFHKGNGELPLGGDGSLVQLIERHKQGTHLAIQPLQQKTPHVFRQFKAPQPRPQLQSLQFIFIRERL